MNCSSKDDRKFGNQVIKTYVDEEIGQSKSMTPTCLVVGASEKQILRTKFF